MKDFKNENWHVDTQGHGQCAVVDDKGRHIADFGIQSDESLQNATATALLPRLIWVLDNLETFAAMELDELEDVEKENPQLYCAVDMARMILKKLSVGRTEVRNDGTI
jgi:hypothetical protein